MNFNSPPYMTWLELTRFFGPRILFAILCGGLIGLERELKNKAAGIKTNILICLGAALYTTVSVMISMTNTPNGYFADPSRVAAQIVSGIGFIGGGAIIQSRGTVLGLTTAATIWIVAAIGILIGIGHSDVAVVSSVITVLMLVATNYFEDKVLGRSLSFACEMLIQDPEGKVRLAINQALLTNNLELEDFDVIDMGTRAKIDVKYRGHRKEHKKFILALWSIPGIVEVKQT